MCSPHPRSLLRAVFSARKAVSSCPCVVFKIHSHGGIFRPRKYARPIQYYAAWNFETQNTRARCRNSGAEFRADAIEIARNTVISKLIPMWRHSPTRKEILRTVAEFNGSILVTCSGCIEQNLILRPRREYTSDETRRSLIDNG